MCLIICVMLFGNVVTVSAATLPSQGTPITPLWNSIDCAELEIFFDGTTGVVRGKAIMKPTASSIEATVALYYLSNGEWYYVDEWYSRVTEGTLLIAETFDAVRGVTYKAIFDIYAYTGNIPEYAGYEYEKTCPLTDSEE